MMCIAVLLLSAGHPGFAFDQRQGAVTEKGQNPESSTNEMIDDVSMDNPEASRRSGN